MQVSVAKLLDAQSYSTGASVSGTYLTPYSFFFVTLPFSSLSITYMCCSRYPLESDFSSIGMNSLQNQ